MSVDWAHLAQVGQLFLYYCQISFLTIGGSIPTLPDQHRYLVETHQLLTDQQFNLLFALSQASPGPNVLYVALFGWNIAGALGAVACLLGICGPSSAIVLAFEVFAARDPNARWLRVIRVGLAPLTVGLVISAGLVLTRGLGQDWLPLGLCAVATAAAVWSKVNPMLLIAVGATLGALADAFT